MGPNTGPGGKARLFLQRPRRSWPAGPAGRDRQGSPGGVGDGTPAVFSTFQAGPRGGRHASRQGRPTGATSPRLRCCRSNHAPTTTRSAYADVGRGAPDSPRERRKILSGAGRLTRWPPAGHGSCVKHSEEVRARSRAGLMVARGFAEEDGFHPGWSSSCRTPRGRRPDRRRVLRQPRSPGCINLIVGVQTAGMC